MEAAEGASRTSRSHPLGLLPIPVHLLGLEVVRGIRSARRPPATRTPGPVPMAAPLSVTGRRVAGPPEHSGALRGSNSERLSRRLRLRRPDADTRASRRLDRPVRNSGPPYAGRRRSSPPKAPCARPSCASACSRSPDALSAGGSLRTVALSCASDKQQACERAGRVLEPAPDLRTSIRQSSARGSVQGPDPVAGCRSCLDDEQPAGPGGLPATRGGDLWCEACLPIEPGDHRLEVRHDRLDLDR